MSLLRRVIALTLLSLLVLSSLPFQVARSADQVSYNPGPASVYHAPLSQMGLMAVAHSYRDVPSFLAQSGPLLGPSQPQSVDPGATRFINDSSYMPQSETTVAVDPSNPQRIVGGFNDARYFFCPYLRAADCPSGYTKSVSGFSTSTDGGASVSKSDDIPGIPVTETNLSSSTSGPGFLLSWGDPSVVAGTAGAFYYGSLAIDPDTGANGIMIAKSNANLWDPNFSCSTPLESPSTNSCWTTKLVYSNLTYQCVGDGLCGTTSFEDKDWLAVDLDTGSAFYGDVYIGWTHFFTEGTSGAYLAMCTPFLSCVMLSGGPAALASGADPYADFSTPAVGGDGTVYLAWCTFGTASTFGPVDCEVRSSSPGGTAFGAVHEIMSFMGIGTDLPGDSAIIGFATEQFRASSTLTFASDSSGATNSLYFAIPLCTSGNYYDFQDLVLFPSDNPGNCGTSAVIFAKSANRGVDWTTPVSISTPAVVVQPTITVDPATAAVVVAYYSSQFDAFDHRLDVIASISNDGGLTFSDTRVTPVSNEPNADPSLFDYVRAFGGAFVVPQYGDYMGAAAFGGKVWVLFTGNYAVEGGTLQSDPFLAVTGETSASLSLGSNSEDAAPGAEVTYEVGGLTPGVPFTLTVDWDGVGVNLASGTTNSSGGSAGNFTVPNIQSQVYVVVARDSGGITAASRLGVGQVSLSGVLASLSAIQSAVGDVSQSLNGLQSSISAQLSSVNSSLSSATSSRVASLDSALNTAVSDIESTISNSVSGPSAAITVVEGLLLVAIALLIVLILMSRSRAKKEALPPSKQQPPSPPETSPQTTPSEGTVPGPAGGSA
ncbi:MAG: hypothetical protein HY297_03490 [Thaumarchaeota archaeon]|nr:hypothetical protein [Nitrososphaerota archaeon]